MAGSIAPLPPTKSTHCYSVEFRMQGRWYPNAGTDCSTPLQARAQQIATRSYGYTDTRIVARMANGRKLLIKS